MVQGNSARRKELAAGRRQDRKDEIERKKAGVARATPAEARARLLDYSARRDARGSMIAWSAAPASRGAPAWCAAFVRDGACPRGRRCKLRHATSLAHLARPATRPAAFAEALPALARARLEAAPAGGKLVYDGKIRSARREASPLYFVECEGALVFDAEDPRCFALWAENIAATTTQEAPAAKDRVVNGVDIANAVPITPPASSGLTPLSRKERRKMKKQASVAMDVKV